MFLLSQCSLSLAFLHLIVCCPGSASEKRGGGRHGAASLSDTRWSTEGKGHDTVGETRDRQGDDFIKSLRNQRTRTSKDDPIIRNSISEQQIRRITRDLSIYHMTLQLNSSSARDQLTVGSDSVNVTRVRVSIALRLLQ